MRLTAYTDYTLRTLIFLALNREKLVTIQDIADAHSISKNHLMKVVHHLGLSGMVETVRGRSGGLRLNQEPAEINVGQVVRNTETDFNMAECFDPANTKCSYSANCALKGVLNTATEAYLDVLDRVTLENLVTKEKKLGKKSSVVSPIQIHPPGTIARRR